MHATPEAADKATATRALVDGALETLADALSRGESDALKSYLAAAARFHSYSFGNVLLIATQRPNASRVAGFHAWREHGRFVKKGEKGIRILAPIVVRGDRRRGAQPEALQNTTAAASDESRAVVGFRVAYVFDVEQTEGEALPEFARTGGDPGEQLQQLRAFACERGVVIEYRDDWGGGHYGASHGGRIELRAGLPAADEFSVLAHELAHEILHQGDGKADRPEKVVRETEAEAVAFVVCTAAGLDTNTAHADYVRLYGGDRKTLAASLGRIQKAAGAILEAIGGAS